MALLAEGNQVWSCYSVLNVLYSLIQKSRINEQLEAEQAGKSAEEIACVVSGFSLVLCPPRADHARFASL